MKVIKSNVTFKDWAGSVWINLEELVVWSECVCVSVCVTCLCVRVWCRSATSRPARRLRSHPGPTPWPTRTAGRLTARRRFDWSEFWSAWAGRFLVKYRYRAARARSKFIDLRVLVLGTTCHIMHANGTRARAASMRDSYHGIMYHDMILWS